MTQHLTFLLLGLGNGAVFAALAVALVLTYRSSGVVNFATGGIALVTAYTYAMLRQGELLSPIPGTPKTIHLGAPWDFWPALIASVLVAAALGLVLHLLIFRPLRNAPPVGKAVAALGVSLFLTALMAARMGTEAVTVEAVFPTGVWQTGSVSVPRDRVYLAAAIVAVAVLVAAVFRHTRLGRATKAVAESEKGAYVSGVSPDRVSAYNWMISSAVAGLGGILIAPIVPLTPVAYTMFLAPALAAAIAGGFTSILVAVATGLGIGMLQSEAQFLPSLHAWLPSAGLPELVPLVLILVVLVVRAAPLPGRGAVITANLGRAPRPQGLLLPTVLSAACGVAGLVVLSGDLRGGLIATFIYGIIALSSVVVTGYAGQVSLAQLPLAGVAAFLLGPITVGWGLPFPLAPVVAALCATVVGVIIGLPALRLRGLTAAVVTFALAGALEAVWFRNLDIVGEGVAVKAPSLLGLDLSAGGGADFPRFTFGLVCLIVLLLVGLGVARLRTSGLGSQMLAVRANERSAAAAGVDVVRIKIIAFGLGAFIAGLGGSLLAYKLGTVTYTPFAAITGLAFFGTAYLAGITSVSGGVFAGVLATEGLMYVVLNQVFTSGHWYEAIGAVLLVLTVIMNPEGIISQLQGAIERWRARRAVPPDEPTSPDVPVDPGGAVPTVIGAPLLVIDGLTVRYGGVTAVDGVSLEVHAGEIAALIGPNGAGKTTAIDAVSGFAAAEGSVRLDGRELGGLKPHQRVRAGLGRTFQAIELYDDLSVAENVTVGLTAQGRATAGGDPVREVLALLGLTGFAERPAGSLSQGQRQLVSIARAVIGRPRMLLLDEPAAGLDSTESLWLGERLRAIRDSGITILLVEHDMGLVLGLCDRVHVLNFGGLIASGSPEEIRADPAVSSAYLGSFHSGAVA
ncbi:ABC-type branched-subunit amino acid transport system ATPase component [Actinocorallia herbida]|uniref:ABC-type branched-subunit amino acid transport system ATPase component n=1 Tax=Actinocorallia herbida TaxID=58109 RepID=A0A3N1D4H6_9ACTN|nr:branched-chain amino acid ABC transporter permease/ATP-binding protein [Actinocorallia herbida]ROO87988.1 ABC-type branched-subunit amino acid transport system ATPase component [Actinocorallia herbida]